MSTAAANSASSILVVDDEPGIASLCERVLSREGHRVTALINPLAAIEYLQETRTDLLLVDIRMPEVDGFDVISRAKIVQPEVAVLVMTGFGTVETAIRALRQGVDGLLLKPFEKGEELVLQRPVVVSKLQRKRHMCAEEFTYLRAIANAPAKVTLVSAQQAAAYYDAEKSKGAYQTVDAYLADLVDILRGEIEELIRLGCSYIQIDSPQYTALLDPDLRAGYRQRGNDPDRLLDLSIEMDNAIVGNHTGITFGLHLCRGNNQSKFYAQGDYGPITMVFQKTKFDRFLLEFDDARSGGFEPLAEVPEDRVVVLGLISSKKPELESKDELKRRINEASQFIANERLALSPQCGFASTLEGNLVTPADQEAKLRLVVETAREVWG